MDPCHRPKLRWRGSQNGAVGRATARFLYTRGCRNLALLATEVSKKRAGPAGRPKTHRRQGSLTTLTGRAWLAYSALDKGPGIASLAEAMADGFSTAGTMGGGLGAMKRIASGLEFFSGSGGTIVLLDVGEQRQTDDLEIAGFAVPYPGERACGDGWSIHHTPQKTVALLVDGIGHSVRRGRRGLRSN